MTEIQSMILDQACRSARSSLEMYFKFKTPIEGCSSRQRWIRLRQRVSVSECHFLFVPFGSIRWKCSAMQCSVMYVI